MNHFDHLSLALSPAPQPPPPPPRAAALPPLGAATPTLRGPRRSASTTPSCMLAWPGRSRGWRRTSRSQTSPSSTERGWSTSTMRGGTRACIAKLSPTSCSASRRLPTLVLLPALVLLVVVVVVVVAAAAVLLATRWRQKRRAGAGGGGAVGVAPARVRRAVPLPPVIGWGRWR